MSKKLHVYMAGRCPSPTIPRPTPDENIYWGDFSGRHGTVRAESFKTCAALGPGCWLLGIPWKEPVNDVSGALVTETAWTRTATAGKHTAAPSAVRPQEAWSAARRAPLSGQPRLQPSCRRGGAGLGPEARPGSGSRREQLNFLGGVISRLQTPSHGPGGAGFRHSSEEVVTDHGHLRPRLC